MTLGVATVCKDASRGLSRREKRCRTRRWKFAFHSRSARNSLRSHCTYVSACVCVCMCVLSPWRVGLSDRLPRRSSIKHDALSRNRSQSRMGNARGENQSSICDIASGWTRVTQIHPPPASHAGRLRPARPARLRRVDVRPSSAIFGRLRPPANFAPRPMMREISRARSIRKIQTSGLRFQIYYF